MIPMSGMTDFGKIRPPGLPIRRSCNAPKHPRLVATSVPGLFLCARLQEKSVPAFLKRAISPVVRFLMGDHADGHPAFGVNRAGAHSAAAKIDGVRIPLVGRRPS